MRAQTLRYAPTFANAPSDPWLVSVSLTSAAVGGVALPIAKSPFAFSVEPGVTSAATSTFVVSYDFVSLSTQGNGNPEAGALGSGSNGSVTIIARDVYGNLQTALNPTFTISFSPQVRHTHIHTLTACKSTTRLSC